MRPMPIDAVILGASPTGLYAVRELARAGLQVAVADVVPGCALHSRHVRRDRRFTGSLEAIETWMRALADAQDAPIVLLPTNDVFIESLLARRDALRQVFRFAAAYDGIAGRLLDKASFHALCAEHGMATPGVWRAAGRDGLAALADRLPFPCILKPMLIHRARGFLRGRKVLLARTADEYRRCLDGIPPDTGDWLVQEIIPGPESEITLFGGFIDDGGSLVQAFTGRKLRQYPPGFGSASLVTSEACLETFEATRDFLARIGFRGICGAEYKRDPRDGRLKIIEINPRPTLWFQVIHDAGVRIAEAAVRDLGSRGPTPRAAQEGSVRWRYALKDFASAWFYRRHGGEFVFDAPDVSGASRMSRRSWPVFAGGDPVPALVEPVGYLRKAWARRR